MLAGDFGTVRPLPFALEWQTDTGAIRDRDGQGTGLTFVLPNKNNNEYVPSLIDVSLTEGLLRLTTNGTATTGGNYGSDNTLVNALGTQFNSAAGPFSVTAKLRGPLTALSAATDQAGIMLGPDQDNYVKIVAVVGPSGPSIQFIDEQTVSGVTTHAIPATSSYQTIGNFNFSTLNLRLSGDPSTGRISGYYQIDTGAWVKMPNEVAIQSPLRSAFFASNGRASLVAFDKADNHQFTVAYDRFEITGTVPTTTSGHPTVTATRPANGATNVSRDAFVAVDVRLPNVGQGIDQATLNSSTVALYRASDSTLVSAHLNTSGGGDAIVLQPIGMLDANTNYTFKVTAGVTDTSGASFVPFQMSFTTGTAGSTTDPSIAFDKMPQAAATGQSFTCLTVGPDGKLYASTFDGKIIRYVIGADGSLSSPQTITTMQTSGPRTITGITFDRTASGLVLWVSNSQYAFENATDWTGKITRLTGANLETAQDYVVGLPRSVRDHMTNQPVLGPDGKLYFPQGSNSAMGAPDNAWGMRKEHLLNGAVLQLDINALQNDVALGKRTLPLNVQTEEGGTYNPFAADARLRIYASGVRNAFDLIWASNGSLYAPTNGSAAGGNTPGYPNAVGGTRIDQSTRGPYTGGNVAALTNVSQTQDDFLFRVVQGGYYGHPNALRAEYVLNGGNPTTGADPNQVDAYPVGTKPDRNYRGAVFDFGKNYSPDGSIQYKGDAFGGKLNGKLLITRYSGGDDVIALTLDAGGNVSAAETGIAGFDGFSDPVDITEDERSGFLYVAEFGGQQVTLLKPIAPGASLQVSTGPVPTTAPPRVYVSDVVGGAAGPSRSLTIRNDGTTTLALPADGLTITGADAAQFVLTKPTLPRTIAPGQSISISIALAASSMSPVFKTATLQIKSNDPSRPITTVPLRGLAQIGTGGGNEPSLQRLMDFFQIPDRVGDPTPDETYFPQPPATPNDEVVAPRFVKSGTAPVTVEPIALMGVSSNPAVRFGYYASGFVQTTTPLFNVSTADAQSVMPNPLGSTSFDPGSREFSFYAAWPGFGERVSWGEDAMNAWETPGPKQRKIRMYPLKNPDGSVVANAYVGAIEEFAGTVAAAYDQNDMVFIVRNVKPTAIGPQFGLENADGVPNPDRLVFNRIQNKSAQFPNVVHDEAIVRIRNTGSSNLTFGSMSINGPWALVSGPGNGAAIAPGASVDVKLRFVATSNPVHSGNQTTGGNANNGGVWDGLLTINTNDPANPTRGVSLEGYWQAHNENNEEPSLQTLVNNIFGYTTTIVSSGQNLNGGGLRSAVGDEVLSGYWNVADPSRPVSVKQLDSFHTQGNTATLFWYPKGGAVQTLTVQPGSEGQSLLPHVTGKTTFSTGGAFGFRIDGEWSDDAKNVQEIADGKHGHHVRFYPLRHRNGNAEANTWLMTMDYQGVNYDYQDNVYLVSNMRPEAGLSAPFGLASAGYTSGIWLDWAPNSEAGLAGYNVYRATSSGGPYTKLNASPLGASAFVDTSAASSGVSYFYRVYCVNTAGIQGGPAGITGVKTTTPYPGAGSTPAPTPPPTPTPSGPFTGVDIGRPTPSGSETTITSGKAYDVAGGGFDIDGTVDHFHFLYQQLSGNFDKRVRVASLTNVAAWTKAGLMVRESLAGSSRNAFMFTTPGSNGTNFSYRENNTGSTRGSGQGASNFPNSWLRLRRVGNVLSGYSSTDGVNWTQIGTFNFSAGLPNTVYFGMAVSSLSTTKTATAQFRDLA